MTDTLTLNSEDTVDLSGFEVELSWLPLAGLQLGLNYTYLDYDFPLQNVDLNGDGKIEDFTRADRSLLREENLEFHVAQAPRHSGSFTLDYTTAPLAFGTLAFHFDWNSTSSYRYSPRLNRGSDARDVMNARLTLADMPWLDDDTGSFSLSLWSTNIGDEEYALYAIDEINSGNLTYAYGQPRTYGVEVVYEF